MISQSEKKEIQKISEPLRSKLIAVLESPDFTVALAYATQISALSNEMINTPFTIRGANNMQVSNEGVEHEAAEENARQNTETALKVMKELDSLAEKLKAIQENLTPSEKSLVAQKIVTTTQLKQIAFGD